jgi:hypothetical protein
VTATGRLLKPGIIFKGKELQQQWFIDKLKEVADWYYHAPPPFRQPPPFGNQKNRLPIQNSPSSLTWISVILESIRKPSPSTYKEMARAHFSRSAGYVGPVVRGHHAFQNLQFSALISSCLQIISPLASPPQFT